MPTGARRPHEPELITTTEAARRLGVQRSNLDSYAWAPKPYQRLEPRGVLYRAAEVDAIVAQRSTLTTPEGTSNDSASSTPRDAVAA